MTKITGSQCRAARALVQISRTTLSLRSGVDEAMIERFEHIVSSPTPREIDAIVDAFEELGAVFISENGAGRGVRLRFNSADAKQIARLENEGGLVAHDRVP